MDRHITIIYNKDRQAGGYGYSQGGRYSSLYNIHK